MFGKMTPTFLLLGGAILIWSLSLGISAKLADSLGAGKGHGAVSKAASVAELSPELKQLKSKIETNPDSREGRLAYAHAVEVQAIETKDNALLMEAVAQYQALLAKDELDPEALLGLAHLCFEAGIIDKAVELYPRYLGVRPSDHRARVEYALTLIQAGDLEGAIAATEQVIAENPQVFQARVTKALVLRLQGKKELAEKEAEEAKRLAPGEEERRRIDEFLSRMDKAHAEEQEAKRSEAAAAQAQVGEAKVTHALSGQNPELVSPGETVVGYFRNHPIVGPKIQKISWPDASTALIELRDFPVEQMPPFAKEKFLSNAKKVLDALPHPVTVRLVEQGSNKILLEIAGGAK